MFNIFKKKSDKILSFLNEVSSQEIDYLSINIKGDHLIAQFTSGDKNGLFEILNNKINFTSFKGDCFSTSSKEVINSNLAVLTKTIFKKFEQSKSEIHKYPNIEQAQSGELKGQEWLKVTNFVLSNSYEKVSKDEGLLIEANIYIGVKDKSSDFEIRFQSFNLDYSYRFMNSGKILLNVYDDKNNERGSAKEASYIGEFYNNRPVILDQILTLMSDCLKSSSFKIFS